MKASASYKTKPCHCGSGLTTRNCCDITAETSAHSEEEAAALIKRAVMEFKQAKQEVASQTCIQVLEGNNQHFDALRLLQHYHATKGNQHTNGVLLTRLNKLRMDDIGTTCDLALHHLEHGDIQHAYRHSRNAIRLAPDFAQSQNVMGLTLTKMHRLHAGEYHLRQALQLRGPTEILCANLASNLKRQGKLSEAEHYYQESLKIDPESETTLIGLINLYEVSRNFSAAWQWLKKTQSSLPPSPRIKFAEVKLLYREKRYTEGLDILNATEGDTPQPHWRLRGELLDKLGEYPTAFQAHQRANEETIRMTSPARHYDEQLTRRHVAELKQFFIKKRMETLPTIGPASTPKPQPIFIIGFPRSGTTLTEQILSSHSRINAGDELHFLHELVNLSSNFLASDLPYPKCFADLWLGENIGSLEAFRDYYLRKAEQIGLFADGASWFTDKMPLNEMHLGLISLIFPQSPILHLVRHPLDVILSTFSNDLTHGYNCALKLETAAKHYMLVRDLVDHYLNALTINYRVLKYEELVTNQEAETRNLLNWIGEPWEQECLNFHQSERYARTASYAQVTERLYGTSTYRYRNYLKQLAPVIPLLEPAIYQLGYTIE